MTTAKDIASFYKLLYNGKLIDEQSSQQMLEILKRQKLNDRIPKYLPNQTIIAHKTGELDGVKHDAGIVFTPKGDYIIVLMSDTANELVAAEIEANVSKAVWEYFNH
jgi:beta-lactamase class A